MFFKIIPLPIAISTVLSFFAVSCSDSEISSSDVPTLSQSIYIVPESYSGEPYIRSTPSDIFFVNVNDKLRICGIYSINGEHLSTDKATPYYTTHKWTIDNEETNSSSVYYSFTQSGIHNITFETVDNLGDTLQSNATVYVNTPAKVTLQSPADNYNQVDGNNENGLELSWNISGVDSWESVSCILYANYNADWVWNSPLGQMDCYNSVNLTGRLDSYIDLIKDSTKRETENITIYWGVQATTENSRGNQEQAFSQVFSFSTKLHNNGNALVRIPVSCQFNQYPEKSHLTGTIISAAGDTLSIIPTIKSYIEESIQPQSNVKVVVCEDKLTEYGCDSLIVDLAPSTKTTTDTLFLKDKVKPNTIPVETTFSAKTPLKFYILDNGSGVNISKIQAIMDNDTLQTYFEDNVLFIENLCKKECNLAISAEDYARNKMPSVIWKIKTDNENSFISGPYARTETDE